MFFRNLFLLFSFWFMCAAHSASGEDVSLFNHPLFRRQSIRHQGVAESSRLIEQNGPLGLMEYALEVPQQPVNRKQESHAEFLKGMYEITKGHYRELWLGPNQVGCESIFDSIDRVIARIARDEGGRRLNRKELPLHVIREECIEQYLDFFGQAYKASGQHQEWNLAYYVPNTDQGFMLLKETALEGTVCCDEGLRLAMTDACLKTHQAASSAMLDLNVGQGYLHGLVGVWMNLLSFLTIIENPEYVADHAQKIHRPPEGYDDFLEHVALTEILSSRRHPERLYDLLQSRNEGSLSPTENLLGFFNHFKPFSNWIGPDFEEFYIQIMGRYFGLIPMVGFEVRLEQARSYIKNSPKVDCLDYLKSQLLEPYFDELSVFQASINRIPEHFKVGGNLEMEVFVSIQKAIEQYLNDRIGPDWKETSPQNKRLLERDFILRFFLFRRNGSRRVIYINECSPDFENIIKQHAV